MTSALAGIPAEVTVDSGKLAGTTPDIRVDAATGQAQVLGNTITTERPAGHLPPTLAFFDDAYQQLLKGGANQ